MNAPIVPRDLPTIRAWLRERWSPGDLFYNVAQAKYREDRPGQSGVDVYSLWEYGTLGGASLWWIAEPMVDLLNAAARSIPDDVVIADLPAPIDPAMRSGFAILEKPYIGVDSEAPDRDITVNAFLWGGTKLPPIRGSDIGPINAVSLSSYSYYDDLDVDARQVREWGVLGRVWAPLGRSDWPEPDALVDRPWPEMDDVALASFVEDRRILAALWTLLHQPGLTTTTIDVGPRALRRRLEREGHPASHAEVRVVNLRVLHPPAEDGTEPAGDDGDRRTYDHRWVVSGHWRNQPFGPGRAQRRLQWIAPYIKGPEDTELRAPEVVRAWKR